MKYPIKSLKSPVEEVHKTVISLIDQGITQGTDPSLSNDSKVHELRKRCKEVRGIILLLKEPLQSLYQIENRWFRDTARVLSQSRDMAILLETAEHLRAEKLISRKCYNSLIHELHIETARPESAKKELVAVAVTRFHEAKQRLTQQLEGKVLSIKESMNSTYRMCRKMKKTAQKSGKTPDFHAWRKPVKYHLYQMELMQNIYPTITEERISLLKEQGVVLGDIQNLVVLQDMVCSRLKESLPKQFRKEIKEACREMRKRLKARAVQNGKKLFTHKKLGLFGLASTWEQ